MIASFDVPDSERHLYFLLNNTLHLCSPLSSSGYKIAGLYSIHHEDKCRYVGQSQNLPSRLASHLSGHYEYADEFRVYFVCEEGYEDFYDRSKEDRKAILENNELRLIQILKPIDNIISNYDTEIPDNNLFQTFKDSENIYHCLQGLKSDYSINITDDFWMWHTEIDNRLMDELGRYNESMEKYNNG